MTIGFYAGTFDPFTIGHLHIIENAIKLFDKVIVGIGENSNKVRKYSAEQMKKAIIETLKLENLNDVEVVAYSGLTIDSAINNNAEYLIRGLRNGTDYDYEENLALVNEELSGLQTIYLRAGKYGSISSSFVNDMVKNNKPADRYVPVPVNNLIKKHN